MLLGVGKTKIKKKEAGNGPLNHFNYKRLPHVDINSSAINPLYEQEQTKLKCSTFDPYFNSTFVNYPQKEKIDYNSNNAKHVILISLFL